MKKTVISVTEAARNFAKYVDRVHRKNVTFVLHKNGVPVARLGPEAERVCTGRQLADALACVPLDEAEARAWSRDLKESREAIVPPVD